MNISWARCSALFAQVGETGRAVASAVGIGPRHELILQLLESPQYNGDEAALLRAAARRTRTRHGSSATPTRRRSSEQKQHAKAKEQKHVDDICSSAAQTTGRIGTAMAASTCKDPDDPLEMDESELQEALAVLKRFYLSLLLLDLINELRLSNAVEKYSLGKAQIQQFQQQSSNFAGTLTKIYLYTCRIC